MPRCTRPGRTGRFAPTARAKPQPKRGRRRPDPFEKVTDQLRKWFDAEPLRTSRQLLEQLQKEYPGLYPDSLLRTLQRRVKIWRQERVQELIFGSSPIECAPQDVYSHSDAGAEPECAEGVTIGVKGHQMRTAAARTGAILWNCGRALRAGASPPGRVDSPWTTPGVDHRLPTLSRLSPTNTTGSTTTNFF